MFYPDHVFATVLTHAISMPLLLTLILPPVAAKALYPNFKPVLRIIPGRSGLVPAISLESIPGKH